MSRWSGFYIFQEGHEVFLVIWQPFLKLEMVGDVVGINFLWILQIHALNLGLTPDGYHSKLYWNRNVLESLKLGRQNLKICTKR